MRRGAIVRHDLMAALGLVLAVAAPAGAVDVAVLKSSDVPAWRPVLEALRRASPGHNLMEYELRGDRAEAGRVIQGLKGKVAMLVAVGPLAAQVARESAPELPLVFCMVQDPGRLGLASAPNVTGVAASIPIKNQLAAFRMVYPSGPRVGVLYNPDNVGRQVQEAKSVAPVVHLILVDRGIGSEREVPEALRALLKGDSAVDALWFPPDPMLLGEDSRRYILSEALKAGKPVFAFSPTLIPEGALASNAPDMASIGELTADLVNRLAGGERGSKIEMLVPRAELVINKKIADKMKIDIPADALRAANKVF